MLCVEWATPICAHPVQGGLISPPPFTGLALLLSAASCTARWPDLRGLLFIHLLTQPAARSAGKGGGGGMWLVSSFFIVSLAFSVFPCPAAATAKAHTSYPFSGFVACRVVTR